MITVLYIYLYTWVWYHYSTLYITWYQGLISLQYFIYTLIPGFDIITVLYIYLDTRVWYPYSTLYIPWYRVWYHYSTLCIPWTRFDILTVLYIYLDTRVWYHYSTLYIPWYQGLISEDSTRLIPLDGSGRIFGCLCMRLVQQLKYGDQFFGSRKPEYRIQIYIQETWI